MDDVTKLNRELVQAFGEVRQFEEVMAEIDKEPEVHPERLSSMLSLIIGRNLKVKRMLPKEHRRITEKGSLLVMDIVVEFESGELADVEIQKIGYLFPGQRASCYASDMVMR